MASPSPRALLHAPLELVVEFLELREAVSLLLCSRALRADAKLAVHVARSSPRLTRHLFQRCASDWADVEPHARFFVRGKLQLCESESESHAETRDAWDAGLLSALAFVQQRLTPWCYTSVSLMGTVDDLLEGRRRQHTRFVCRPVFVRLVGLPSGSASQWTPRQVAAALNRARAGLGDSLVLDHREPRADDLLGLHWDGISASGDACALCEWRERVLAEYAELRPEMLSLSLVAGDRHQRQAEEDAILRSMLAEGAAVLPAHLPDDRELRRAAYCALSWYHRRQCAAFYRPLRRLLARSGLRFVALADTSWASGGRGAQLIGGVAPGGALVGLLRVAAAVSPRRAPPDPPLGPRRQATRAQLADAACRGFTDTRVS